MESIKKGNNQRKETIQGEMDVYCLMLHNKAPSNLQLPLWQWGVGNVYLVYLLVLSKAKR